MKKKIKLIALDSYIDETRKEICVFGHKVKFDDEQFFIASIFYKWYLEELQKNKKSA